MCVSKPKAPKAPPPPEVKDPAEFQFATDVKKGSKKTKAVGTESLQIPLTGGTGGGSQSGLKY